jgi:superfamily II helicase
MYNDNQTLFNRINKLATKAQAALISATIEDDKEAAYYWTGRLHAYQDIMDKLLKDE